MFQRAADKNPLPEGTLAVGAGLIISGLASYGFLSAARRMLGSDDFASVSQLWFITFILAPGFFLPVEQEVGRALAQRRALGQGGMPVIRKAAVLALGLSCLITVVILGASSLIVDKVFHGSWSLLAALLFAFIGYATAHFSRGLCSGSGQFGPYGMIMGTEGIVRILLAAALVAAGVSIVGVYGILVGLPIFVAVLVALPRLHWHRGVLTDGPPAEWSELTPNLGWLLAGSVLAAFLVNAGPVAANLLADRSQRKLVSDFAAGVLVARVPLFLFQAVQAALLPKLARLAAMGAFDEFTRGFRKLLTVVIGVGAFGTFLALVIGPQAVKLFFDDILSRRTVTLLALSSALYMVAVAIAQALIALHGHKKVAIGWFVGVAVFVVITISFSKDLLLRVEAGLVAGSAAAVLMFALFLRTAKRQQMVDVSADYEEPVLDLPGVES
jgi:O-antigen/teichoic acid export membrane protein